MQGQAREADDVEVYKALVATNYLGQVSIAGAFADVMLDAWGHRYHVRFDDAGSGKITLNGTLINDSVAIWSDGPNGTNEFGGGDDVASWKMKLR